MYRIPLYSVIQLQLEICFWVAKKQYIFKTIIIPKVQRQILNHNVIILKHENKIYRKIIFYKIFLPRLRP